MAERQILDDTINIRRPKALCLPQRSPPFRPFALKQMAPAGASVQHFAGAGYLETFAYRLFGLNAFGASHIVLSFSERLGVFTRSTEVRGDFSRDFELLSRQLAQLTPEFQCCRIGLSLVALIPPPQP